MNINNENTIKNPDESSPNASDHESIESWTFLEDDSSNAIHQGTSRGSDNITEDHDEDTKLSTKASRSSSSCLS